MSLALPQLIAALTLLGGLVGLYWTAYALRWRPLLRITFSGLITLSTLTLLFWSTPALITAIGAAIGLVFWGYCLATVFSCPKANILLMAMLTQHASSNSYIHARYTDALGQLHAKIYRGILCGLILSGFWVATSWGSGLYLIGKGFVLFAILTATALFCGSSDHDHLTTNTKKAVGSSSHYGVTAAWDLKDSLVSPMLFLCLAAGSFLPEALVRWLLQAPNSGLAVTCGIILSALSSAAAIGIGRWLRRTSLDITRESTDAVFDPLGHI